MTLTIQDLGSLGELLGSVAVLVTLVYLAMQTRQNTMAIGAQLDAARLANVVNLNLATSELSEVMFDDVPGPAKSAVSRQGQFWAAWMNTLQWQFMQARQGALPSYNEAGMKLAVQSFFTQGVGFREFWEATGPSGFRPEFVEWVEEQRPKAA